MEILNVSFGSANKMKRVQSILESLWKASNKPRKWRIKLIKLTWPEIIPVLKELRDYYYSTLTL